MKTDQGTARPAAFVILACLAAYLALSGFLLWRSAVLAPYSDMFEWVDAYYRFAERGDLIGYLLQPHLVHRLAWTRAVLALDIQSFGAGGYLFLAVGAFCLTALAALMTGEAARAAGPLALPAAAFAAMLTLMAGNILDASIPINTLYAHGLVFVAAALALTEPEDPARPTWPRRICALACLALGALGNAAALAAWPVMLVGAARNRDWRWFGAVLAFGGALTALYVSGEQQTASTAPWTAERLHQSTLYALNFLGLPWTRAVPALGWVIGAGVAALGCAAVTLRGGPDASRGERLATQFVLYSLAASAMAGLGRAEGAGASDTPLRYALFLVPMHVGLLMLAMPMLARFRRPHVTSGAFAAAAIVLLGHQAVMGLAAIRTTDVNRQLIADFRQGLRSPQMTPTIHTDLTRAAMLDDRMRRDGLYQALDAARPRANVRSFSQPGRNP